jgi:hypothetical protein
VKYLDPNNWTEVSTSLTAIKIKVVVRDLLSKLSPWLARKTIPFREAVSDGAQKVAEIVYEAVWLAAPEYGWKSVAAVLLATLLIKSTTS